MRIRFEKQKFIKFISGFMLAVFIFSGLPAEVLFGSLAKRGGKIVDSLYLSKLSKKVVDNYGLKKASASLNPSNAEYLMNIGPVNGSTSANYVYAAFYNPVNSGKTAVISKFRIRADTVNTANYRSLTLRRISTSTGGTLVSTSNIPKKNTSSDNSVIEIRHTGATVSYPQGTNGRMAVVVGPGAAGQTIGQTEQDFAADEKLVIQPGEGLALYQETAGDADQRVRLYLEWDEESSALASGGEYLLNFPRVEVAAAAGYVYHSFFNPASSGKTAVIKRLSIDVDCDTTAVYTNNIGIRRITAASGGTQISTSDVPKKNTATADSVMDLRSTNVTVTWSQAATSRFSMITPCGAAGQPNAHRNYRFGQDDEKIVIQQGEGIALFSETSGDVDQIVRMALEWQEAASTPSSGGEYMMNYPRVELAAAANAKYHTFFNPTGSGKNAVIKRLGIYVDADTTAVYQAISVRRISAASGGTLIAAADVPKKNTATADSAMELRYNNVTATLSGSTVDASLASITGPGTVGQLMGQKEIFFDGREKLVLKPGEGIALYTEATGDVDQYVKFLVEWQESASAPDAGNEYLTSVGPVTGNTGSNYVYAAFYNSSASGVDALIKRIAIRITAATTATSIPFSIKRISTSTGGTLIAAANLAKKNSSSTDSSMEVRRTGVTVGYDGTERIAGVTAPSAVAAAAATSLSGYAEMTFTGTASSTEENLVLRPGEGIALAQEGTGYTGHRVILDVEWEEVAHTSSSGNEYIFSSPELVGSTSVNYVYAALYNPANSGRNFVVSRIETRIQATTTATYVAATVRRISTTSGGTLIDSAGLAKKNSGTATSTAEIRHTAATVSLSGDNNSRIFGVTSPGNKNQDSGIYQQMFYYGQDFVLQPGEGLALYQEAAGDTDQRYFFKIQWSEQNISSGITISGNLYASDEASNIVSQPEVALAVGDTDLYTAAAAGSGTFSFTNVTQPSDGAIITIWLNTSGGIQGTLVFKYGNLCTGTPNCTGMNIYQDRVVIDSKDGSAVTVANLAACDNDSGTACSDTDIGFTANSNKLILTNSGSVLRLKDASANFVPGGDIDAQNFYQSDGLFDAGSGNDSFNGNFTVSGGVATSSSNTLTIAGNFTNNASFNHNSGTIAFGLSSGQSSTISGSSALSFYNFNSVTPGKTLIIEAGKQLSIQNSLVLNGQDGLPVNLQSSSSGVQWLLDLHGSSNVSHVMLTDSGCQDGTNSIDPSETIGNNGNNGLCWGIILRGGSGTVSIIDLRVGGADGGGDQTVGGDEGGGGVVVVDGPSAPPVGIGDGGGDQTVGGTLDGGTIAAP